MLISAELRWFWKSACPAGVARLFDEDRRFASPPEIRMDRYLPQPDRHDISIKSRGGKDSVEVKALIANIPDPELKIAPGFEIWGKWDASLPIGPAIELHKRRSLRAFDVEGPEAVEIPLADTEPSQACHIELTRIEIGTDLWWTLGFEALGGLADVPMKLHRLVRHFHAGGFLPEGGTFTAYPTFLDRFAAATPLTGS